jgi:hypothetical protein
MPSLTQIIARFGRAVPGPTVRPWVPGTLIQRNIGSPKNTKDMSHFSRPSARAAPWERAVNG